jgi:cell division protein FtsN
VEVAEAPEPHATHPAATRYAAAVAPQRHGGVHLIESAMASEAVSHSVGGRAWAIQVGAYGNAGQAQQAAGAAGRIAGNAHPVVASVKSGHAMLYRARLSGFTHDAAVQACHKLAHGHGNCILVAPSA